MRTITFFASRKAKETGLNSLFFALISIPLLVAGMLAAGPALAVHDAANFDNIEMDGNTTNDGGGTPGVDDWNDVYADCVSDPVNCAPATTSALRQRYIDDSAPSDNTIFDGGIKDTLPIADWTCTTGGVQNKSDIFNALGATYTDGGDVILYTAVDRDGNNGTANFGVWLTQAPVDCVSAGGSTPFTGQHTDGDVLLVAEFDQGGSVSTINVYRWSHGPDGIVETADDCLGGDGGPTDNADPDDCSLEGEPFAQGVNCGASGPGDDVCGITNDLVTIDATWRTGIDTNAFYEVGANLSELVGGTGCFASALVETRSSTSLTATLKDFTRLDLSTCGTLEVAKECVGGSGTFGFTVSPTAGGPDDFDLGCGSSQFFGTVDANTYTITEDALPAGPAAPNGWNLTGIQCVGGTPGAPTFFNGGHDGGEIDVDIALNDDVVCTFTNTFTPPPGTITIEKVCDSTTPGGQTFDFALGGFGGSSTEDCADGSVTLGCGASITCEELLAGDYTVNETVPAGWVLTDVACANDDTNCDPGLNPDATITLGEDEDEVVTFSNTENATVEICKATLPPESGGPFNFSGDLGDFPLNDGECSEVFEVAPDTPYDVTEAADPDFTLSDISCTGVNWSATSPTVTVTPDPGEAVQCTFTNTENPGYVQICKNTVTTSGANPTFNVELTGPDGDLPQSTGLQNGECDFGLGDPGQIDLTADGGYAVSEDAVAGWDTEVACVGSGGAEDPNNIDVSPNEEVVCTFTNTQRGVIEVEKQTDPDGSAQTFDFTGNLAGNIGDGGVLFSEVVPGQYSTTETVPAGWDLTSIVCDDGNSTGDTGTATATYNVEPGETVRCVFTNTIQRGNIVVVKQTDPDGSAEDFGFTTNYSGGFSLTDGQSNDSGPLLSSSEAGNYVVMENAEPGWDLQSATCDDGSDPDDIVLDPGETVTCTFTNVIRRGSIIVVKQTDPDGSSASFDFTTSYAPGGFSLTDGQNNNSGPLLPSSEAGPYSVAETGLPAGWDLSSATCDDGSDPGAIDLAPDEEVVCTFNNTIRRGNIVVVKQTDPDGAPDLFSFTTNYGDPFALADGDSEDSGDLLPTSEGGTYSVAETGIPDGWDFLGASCDDGSDPGSIDLAPDETVTCTFNNRARASVTVVKIVQGGLDGEFCFEAFGPSPGTFCIDTDGGTGQQTNENVIPGDYSIVETDAGQFILVDSFCDNGDTPASFTANPGDEITCTFVNALPVAVPVNNFWALLALALMLLATGWYFRPASMRR